MLGHRSLISGRTTAGAVFGCFGRIEEFNVLAIRTTRRRTGAAVDTCSLDGVDESSVGKRIEGSHGGPALVIRRKGSTADGFFAFLNGRCHGFILLFDFETKFEPDFDRKHPDSCGRILGG